MPQGCDVILAKDVGGASGREITRGFLGCPKKVVKLRNTGMSIVLPGMILQVVILLGGVFGKRNHGKVVILLEL